MFSLLFLNLGFEFRGTFTPLSGYRFDTALFQRLQRLPALASIPLPIPVPFLKGLDMTKDNERTGLCCANFFLLGQIRNSKDPSTKPFPAYYLVAYLVKEPIALEILFMAGLGLLSALARVFRQGVIPSLSRDFDLSGLFPVQPRPDRIRHILPCLALVLPIGASCFARWDEMRLRWRAALGLLVGYAAVSVLWYAPHLIPYTNELVWDKKTAFRVLADSNLDWNQAEWVVRDYVRLHPEVAYAPLQPTTGRVVASMNILSGILWPEQYRWLRERCRPVGHIAYAQVLCEVPPDPALAGVSRR